MLLATKYNPLAIINPLKMKINLNYIYTFSPYRAGNTFRLGYKNQSVNVV